MEQYVAFSYHNIDVFVRRCRLQYSDYLFEILCHTVIILFHILPPCSIKGTALYLGFKITTKHFKIESNETQLQTELMQCP